MIRWAADKYDNAAFLTYEQVKRPIYGAKETYLQCKRDLYILINRVGAGMAKETVVKRDYSSSPEP